MSNGTKAYVHRWDDPEFYAKIERALKEDSACVKVIKAFVKYYRCQERCREQLIKEVNALYDGLPMGEAK